MVWLPSTELHMRTTLRKLSVAAAAVSLIACADAPSAPHARNTRAERLRVAPLGEIEVPDSTGHCRSGYAVVNGRCEPV